LECNAKYRTKFGGVCELALSQDGAFSYCAAAIPAQGIMDAKFMTVEATQGEVLTPEEFFNKIPIVKPLATACTIKETGKNGHYKFVGMKMADLPIFEWEQLFNLVQIKPVKTVV
jgi:hypothetical protein